jgi:drug/metabolite transporter (DMT)-like permease
LGAIVTASYLYFIENIIPKNYAIGTLCLSLGFFVFLRNQRHDIKKINISTHRYLFIMSMCFSANGIMQWYNLKTYDVVFLAVHQELTVLIIAAFLLYFLKQSPMVFFKLDYITVMALLVFAAVITGMYGLKTTNPFIASIVSLTSSIFTMILAVYVLKERFRWSYIISLFMVIFGAWLLG